MTGDKTINSKRKPSDPEKKLSVVELKIAPKLIYYANWRDLNVSLW